MSRPQSPPSNPRDLPHPKEEDLDFDDPPSYLKNPLVRTFWCLNKNVREKIMQNRPKVVFFCFHKSFCTFQVDNDHNTARGRIENHFKKNPNHRIAPQELHHWERAAEERRCLRDARRKQKHYPRSPSYHHLSSASSRSPSRNKRERSPSRLQNRSPRDGGARDWGRMQLHRERSSSPALKKRERSPYRYQSPLPSRRRSERSPSPGYDYRRERSPSPGYTRDRSPSPGCGYRRYRSPSPGYRVRKTSPDTYPG